MQSSQKIILSDDFIRQSSHNLCGAHICVCVCEREREREREREKEREIMLRIFRSFNDEAQLGELSQT